MTSLPEPPGRPKPGKGTAEEAVLRAVARALIPSGGSFPPGAEELRVADHILEIEDEMDPTSQGFVRLLLFALDVAPWFGPPGRRFSRLTPREAEAFVAGEVSKGSLGATAIWLLRLLVEANFVGTPDVQQALGIRREPMYTDPPVPAPLPPVATSSYPTVADGSVLDVDACVIGSGAGGAPAAALLAEAGWKVAVLEEGPPVSRADFEGSPIRRIARYYRYNGIYFTLGKPMIQISFAGSVGGTTVFNSGTCLSPSDRTLEKWSKELKLPALAPATSRASFEKVLRFLQVAPSRPEVLGMNAEVSRRGAAKLVPPLPHGVIPRPAPGCRGSDECVIGCPTDAKRSMQISYLPRALAAGARIYARTSVQRIRAGPGGAARWSVQARLRPPPGSSGPGGTLTVRCRHVVVAAGALHTPYLLPAAGDRHARRHRGRHLRIHPSFDVGGDFPEPIRGWRGVLQSYYIDDTEHGIMLEATFQPRGMISMSGLTPFTGQRFKEFFPRLPHLAIMGGLVMDETEGTLGPYLFGRPWAFYNMVDADLRKVARGLALAGRVFLEAGATRIFLPLHGGQVVRDARELDRLERNPPPAEAMHLLSFHPLGTARMAGEPELGALDPTGTVWGAPGLHVSDASMLPGSPGVNPQISIMALAERNAQAWIAQGVDA